MNFNDVTLKHFANGVYELRFPGNVTLKALGIEQDGERDVLYCQLFNPDSLEEKNLEIYFRVGGNCYGE